MRCPDCNRFVPFDSEVDPEINDVSIDEEGNITAEVRIVNGCGDCGTELTEANFQPEGQIDVGEHKGEGHELEAEEDGAVRTSRSGNFDKKTGQFKPSFGRYAKTFYGFELEVQVKCSCKEEVVGSVTLSDEIQASAMDSLV